MPFKSEKQRRFLWLKHPKVARKWAAEESAFGVPHEPLSKRVRLSTIRTPEFVAVRAKRKGKEIGHLLSNNNTIMSIGVDEPYRRRGIATRMYEKAGRPRHSDELTADARKWKSSLR